MPLISLAARPLGPEPAFLAPEAAREVPGPVAVDLPTDADPRALADPLDRAAAIRITFANFADGRGFGLARRLRDLGFRGRLRAAGWLLPDQKAHARACGFDEIELAPDLLARHGAAAWDREAAAPPYRRRRSA